MTTIRRSYDSGPNMPSGSTPGSPLGPLCERLAFVSPPYDLSNVASSADDFEAGLIVLDYIQRIGPPGDHADNRGSVDATMDTYANSPTPEPPS